MRLKTAKGVETKTRIILAAADLFHKQGVRATSPDEIIAASKTGKGQFYHYFKSKQGLVHAVLQHHLNSIRTGTAPLSYDISSWRQLDNWFFSNFELQMKFGMRRGCPFGTVANEVTEGDELIRQDLNLIFEVMKNKLAAFFIQEKAKGRLSQDARENELANFCIATMQGIMLMAKVQRNSEAAQSSIREALTHLRRYAVARGR